MGLTSGPHGAKQALRDRYRECFRAVPTLADARIGAHIDHAHAVCLLDGNVLIMGMSFASTLEQFVSGFCASCRAALVSAATVVVVFDEPEYVTAAKLESQRRRDTGGRAKSEGTTTGTASPPVACKTDAFGAADLHGADDVRPYLTSRKSRYRFIDEVVRCAFKRLRCDVARWAGSGERHASLAVHRVDAAGATRPFGEPRRVEVMATDDALAKALSGGDPIGEGDLKMIEISARVHAAAKRVAGTAQVEDAPLVAARLVLHATIDTDALVLCCVHFEAMERARSHAGTVVVGPPTVRDVIAFRERAATTAAARDKRKAACLDDALGNDAYYLLCDVASLARAMRVDCFGDPRMSNALAPTVEERERLYIALACVAACAGCDFHIVPGFWFDVGLQAAFRLLRCPDVPLRALDGLRLSTTTDNALAAGGAVVALLRETAVGLDGTPRGRQAAEKVRKAIDEPTSANRALWTASYWCRNEHRELMPFGFLPLSG